LLSLENGREDLGVLAPPPLMKPTVNDLVLARCTRLLIEEGRNKNDAAAKGERIYAAIPLPYTDPREGRFPSIL